MNTGAELVLYFCANTQLKTFNGGWTPLTPSGYTSALIHGVKEIQSSIWPAVSQLLITNDAWERDFAGIQHSSRIFIGWRGHICLIFLVRMLTLYRVDEQTGTFLYALSAYALTSSNIDRFSNLFHCLNQTNICNNIITKNPTTPQVYRYTTLECQCFKSNNWKKRRPL